MTSIAASTAIVGAGLLAGSGVATAGESYDKGGKGSSSSSSSYDHTHTHVHHTADPSPRTGLVGGLLGGLGGTVNGLLTGVGGTVDNVLGV